MEQPFNRFLLMIELEHYIVLLTFQHFRTFKYKMYATASKHKEQWTVERNNI